MMRFQLNNQDNAQDILKVLRDIDSDELYLEISEDDLKEAESVSQNHSNQTARNCAYNNYLCLSLLKKWIKDNLLKESYQNNILPRYWEFINGTSIIIGSKKLVLIPSDALDTDGFELQQEWVDIPNFVADYYVPVQVDLEENYIHFWGFIPRETLIKKLNSELDNELPSELGGWGGIEYDPIYRTYSIARESMIDDIDLLWTACELCDDEKGEIVPLPNRSETEVKALIKTLSQHSPYSPRLEVEFEKWGALLNDADSLQELYVERLLKSPNRPMLIWLNERLEDTIATPKNQTSAYRGVRSSQPQKRSLRFREMKLDASENIDRAIQQLIAESSQKVKGISSNMADEDILCHLLLKGEKKISGEAAEIFWAIVSRTSSIPTRQIMTIERQLAGHPIILKIASVQTPSQKVVILLRVCSGGEQMHLPPGLQLMLLDEKGNPIPKYEATARNQPLNECIQSYFSADVGEAFGCSIILRGESITERLLV